MQLHFKGKPHNIVNPVMGRVVLPDSDEGVEDGILLILENGSSPKSTKALSGALIFDGHKGAIPYSLEKLPYISGLPQPCSLEEGNIVLLNPSGLVSTLFRSKSRHNVLFLTEQCNSNCLMCPQPPTQKNDISYRMALNQRLINLIPKETAILGITGGEPTILGRRLPELLAHLAKKLPETEICILTNGRVFVRQETVKHLAALGHSKMKFAITLHSDYFLLHDYASQIKGAFSQTITGLHNLARYGLRVEIRVVLHKLAAPRLERMADFIYRNLPFAEHVAFMGLEYMGFALLNDDLIWVEPQEYMAELEKAVGLLTGNGMSVSIYNLPHCLLSRSLWPYATQSISDWKRTYLEKCRACEVFSECGGVFESVLRKHDLKLKPISR